MGNYRVTILAEVSSSLPKRELEAKLVTSLFNIETEEKISDGENEQLKVIDYELTEAIPIRGNQL